MAGSKTSGHNFHLRNVLEDDIPAIAALHVKAWGETYPHYLNPPAIEVRTWQLREIIKNTGDNSFLIVAEADGNELVAFAYGKTYTHENLPDFKGELNKIYVLSSCQRLG